MVIKLQSGVLNYNTVFYFFSSFEKLIRGGDNLAVSMCLLFGTLVQLFEIKC